jgi:hypothetical protein
MHNAGLRKNVKNFTQKMLATIKLNRRLSACCTIYIYIYIYIYIVNVVKLHDYGNMIYITELEDNDNGPLDSCVRVCQDQSIRMHCWS